MYSSGQKQCQLPLPPPRPGVVHVLDTVDVPHSPWFWLSLRTGSKQTRRHGGLFMDLYPTDYRHRRLQRIDGTRTKIRVGDVAALANIPLGLGWSGVRVWVSFLRPTRQWWGGYLTFYSRRVGSLVMSTSIRRLSGSWIQTDADGLCQAGPSTHGLYHPCHFPRRKECEEENERLRKKMVSVDVASCP